MTMAARGADAPVIPDVRHLCDYDPAGDYGTHRAHHLGEPCPYAVAYAIMTGEPDPRGYGIEWTIPVDMAVGKGAGSMLPPLTLNGGHGNMFAHAARVKLVRHRTMNYLRNTDPPIPVLEHVRVVLHLRPSTNRTRDRDNLVATLKPCIDAMQPDPVEDWPGIVPNDDPRYVSWVPPVIHAADKALGPAMWLVLTVYPSEADPG